jgi:hypothetical protein
MVNEKLLRSTVPAVNVRRVAIVRFAPSLSARVLVLTMTFDAAAFAAVVHVPVPDAASKFTVSPEMGGPLPGAPPDKADQLAVLAASHVPSPPTQK